MTAMRLQVGVNGLEKGVYVLRTAAFKRARLRTQKVAEVVEKHTVALSLQEGSQEAGFLAAFCPLDVMPSLVIVQ